MRTILLLPCLLAVTAATASPPTVGDEHLPTPIPQGYVIGHRQDVGSMAITELVPEGESVENWTQMYTVLIVRNMKQDDAIAVYRAEMERGWKAACESTKVHSIREGVENGYPFSLWLQSCELNKSVGRPEVTFFKAIGGADALYVVQKAFRYDPSKDDVIAATQYLRDIEACDLKREGHPCPDYMRQEPERVDAVPEPAPLPAPASDEG